MNAVPLEEIDLSEPDMRITGEPDCLRSINGIKHLECTWG